MTPTFAIGMPNHNAVHNAIRGGVGILRTPGLLQSGTAYTSPFPIMLYSAATMAPPLNVEEAATSLEYRTKAITIGDLARTAQQADQILTNIGEMVTQWKNLKIQGALLMQMIRDYWNGSYRAIPWYSIAVGVATLTYAFAPSDLVPDRLSVLGSVDNELMLSLGVASIQLQLRDYCIFKGIPLDDLLDSDE